MGGTTWMGRLAVPVVATAVVLIVVGCGGGSSSETTSLHVPPRFCGGLSGEDKVFCEEEYVTEHQGGNGEGEASGGLGEYATYDVEAPEGYMGQFVLERGPPEHARPGKMNGELLEGSGCEIDSEKDAVEPLRLMVVNTTGEYSASPTAVLHVTTPHGEEPPVSIELGYTEGAECGNQNGSASEYEEGEHNLMQFHPIEPLGPGEDISAEGYVVLEDFYSPDHPEGNSGQFAGMLLTLEPAYTEEGFEGYRTTGFDQASGSEILSRGRLDNSWLLVP